MRPKLLLVWDLFSKRLHYDMNGSSTVHKYMYDDNYNTVENGYCECDLGIQGKNSHYVYPSKSGFTLQTVSGVSNFCHKVVVTISVFYFNNNKNNNTIYTDLHFKLNMQYGMTAHCHDGGGRVRAGAADGLFYSTVA